MGTLHTQPPRNYQHVCIEDVGGFLNEVSGLVKKHKVSMADVIEAHKVLELKRRNDLYVANGDIYDEQMAGIGKEIQQVATSIEKLSDSIERKE